MIKALFFDIDGTLVSFKTHKIPQSAVDAIEKAHQKGIKIFISTGRPLQIINNLTELQEKNLIDGYITMNGAYCFVGDTVLHKHPIDRDEVEILVDECREHHYPCIFVGEKEISVVQPDDILRKIFYEFLQIKEFPLASFKEAVSYDIYQLTPFFDLENQQRIAGKMKNCEFGRWNPAFVDITEKSNTKQNGMIHIMKHFGLDVSETMTFGDGGNDISMLKHAAIGVAMGNAGEDVKAAADYVTASVDDDGVAKALHHFGILQ